MEEVDERLEVMRQEISQMVKDMENQMESLFEESKMAAFNASSQAQKNHESLSENVQQLSEHLNTLSAEHAEYCDQTDLNL